MLRYAILSLLREGADHGYRLKQRLDERLGPVWRVNQGQVYQVLERLRRLGWVEELPPDADMESGRERWPVAITARGRDELDRWVSAALSPSRPPGPARNDLVGRLAVAGDDAMNAVREGLLTERVAYDRAYERLTTQLDALDRHLGSGVEVAQRLALEAARLSIRAHLEWIDIASEQLTDAGSTLPRRTVSRRRPRRPA